MRPGRPKSRHSNAYWTSKGQGGKRKTKKITEKPKGDFHPADKNYDGIVTEEELRRYKAECFGKNIVDFCAFLFLLDAIYLVITK
jgi:hypothetical protein